MLRVLDLFSGIGGWSLGLERTGGFKTVAFVEVDERCQAVLKKHWPDVPVFGDVKTITKRTLQDEGIGRIDVICGGFPCQDISFAGKGAGLAGERSGLWWEMFRIIEEIRPAYALIENVSALRSRGLDEVLGAFASIRFDVEWHCIPAAAVGANHQRDRIWLMAYPSSESESEQGYQTEALSNSREARLESSRCGSRFKQQNSSQVLADATSERCPEAGELQYLEPEKWFTGGSAAVPYTLFAGLEGYAGDGKNWGGRSQEDRSTGAVHLRCGTDAARWWEVEPGVGRVVDGVPDWAHRLKELGNSLVPQIPELIGRAILIREYEENHGT